MKTLKISKTITPIGYRPFTMENNSKSDLRKFINWKNHISSMLSEINGSPVLIGTIHDEYSIDKMNTLIDQATEILTFGKRKRF